MRYKSTVGFASVVRIGGRGVNVKKIVGLLVVALLIYFVIVQPDSAATSLQNIGSILKNAADSVTRFFTRLV